MYDEKLRNPFELLRIPLFTFVERRVKLWGLWRKSLLLTEAGIDCGRLDCN